MRHLRDHAARTLAQLRESPADQDGVIQAPLMDKYGFPADRSICPACVFMQGKCDTCGGAGVVCPKCRGGRVVRDGDSTSPVFHGCPDCTDWSDYQTHEWGGEGSAHNWPRFKRVVEREASSIDYYRRTRRDRDLHRVLNGE